MHLARKNCQNPPIEQGTIADLRGYSHRILATLLILSCLISCGNREPKVINATREKILLLGNGAEPKALDPHLVSSVGDSAIMRAMFEGLVTYHPSQDSVDHPGVAERWEPNDDASEWTFYLRKNAKWSNGDPVTAHDFVYSYNRLLHPEMGGPYTSMLYFLKNAEDYNKGEYDISLTSSSDIDDEGKSLVIVVVNGSDLHIRIFDTEGEKVVDMPEDDLIEGQDLTDLKELLPKSPIGEGFELTGQRKSEVLEKIGLVTDYTYKARIKPFDMVGVKAIDDHTLVCTLETPTPFFPDIVKHTTWLPVHGPTIEKFGGMTEHFTKWQAPGNCVSNGPFQVTEWRVGGYVKVRRNLHYWDNANVKLNGVNFYPIDNQFTEERAFRNGLLHKTYIVPPNLIGIYKEKKDPNLKLQPYIGSYFYRFNTTRETTANIHLRRALSAAIDRERIVKYVTQAGEQAAFGFTPPTKGGYQPPNRIKFDPEAARAHLEKAGYASGDEVPEISLFINTSEGHKAVAIAIQDMWRTHLGIDTDKVTILNQEWKVFQKTVEDLRYDIARAGWIGDYLDPTTFLNLFRSTDTHNQTGWKNKDYDRLLLEAASIVDPEERYAKLQEAENILLDELPVTPIYWYTTKYLIHPDVKNWNPLLLDNHPFKFVDLSAD